MQRELYIIFSIYAFAMGAATGSFLNVVIWRTPRGESIVRPPSHCPKCGARIRWWQNLPILSWLMLRGKCANCKKPISPRYILVETLVAFLFLLAWFKYGILAPFMWVWLSLMVVGSFIDYDLQVLPDFVTVGGMIYGVVLSVLGIVCLHWPVMELFVSLGGLAAGFGVMWLIRYLGTKAFKREAMGMGDVFLMGAIGAIFGPVAACFTLMAAAVVGSIVGLGMIALNKARLGKFVAIPFGPYLCAGCTVWMFWGPQILDWYFTLLGLRT